MKNFEWYQIQNLLYALKEKIITWQEYLQALNSVWRGADNTRRKNGVKTD